MEGDFFRNQEAGRGDSGQSLQSLARLAGVAGGGSRLPYHHRQRMVRITVGTSWPFDA